MNVTLEGLEHQKGAQRTTTSYHIAENTGEQQNRGYTLDISGADRDHAAYANHGKSAEDLMCEAQATEAAIQSEYVTVMSNSVSGQDVAKLQEEGYNTSDMTAEDMVNTVDQIKAVLAQAGIIVAGYNDDLDMEQLEQITGSKELARVVQKNLKENDIPVTKQNAEEYINAYQTAKQIPQPTEGTTKYMVENHMDPTIENFYVASYSGSGDGSRQSYGYYDQNGMGYYAKKADDYDWEALRGQMEDVIHQTGLPVNEDTLGLAKFLVEKGIPLTSDTLSRMSDIAEVSYPFEKEKLLKSIAIAVTDGKKAVKADLTADESMLQQAVRIKKEADRITHRAVEQIVADGAEITIRGLWQREQELSQNLPGQQEEQGAADGQAVTGQTPAYVKAMRQLEEVRLAMTVQANYALIKKGCSIDTTELSQLVEELKAQEAQLNQTMFQTQDPAQAEERAAIYKDTQTIVEDFPEYPLAVVGRVRNLAQAPVEAQTLRQQYQAAGESYETFMTKPRADLGDSIRKAFRNVDDILTQSGYEITDANRRAVRILGYNRMEITAENMEKVKDADLMLQRITEKLTPAATLQMIRENRNPLTMSLEELEGYLTGQDRDEAAKQEKFSQFLYKLDNTDGITEEERESFLGIYRLFRQVEKSDGAVIGNLIGQQAQLSVSGLLSALRNRKKEGMDIRISDETGTVSGVRRQDKAIDEQILTAYRTYEDRLVSDIYDHMDPAVLARMKHDGNDGMNASLEQYRQMQRDTSQKAEVEAENEQIRKEYQSIQVQEIREAADINDSSIQNLLDGKQPVTVHHLLAIEELYNRKNNVYSRLEGQLTQEIARLSEAFSDKEQAQTAYEELVKKGSDLLERMEEAPHLSFTGNKDIVRMAGQLKLAGAMAREEQYMIPVYVEEELTTIHLTVKHEAGEKGKVAVSMDTAKGRIKAEFAVSQKHVIGNVECSEDAARSWMDQVTKKMQEYVDKEMPEEETSSSGLYRLAKAFISAVQKQQ